jgi:hypothetical protein
MNGPIEQALVFNNIKLKKEPPMTKHLYPRIWKHSEAESTLKQESLGGVITLYRYGYPVHVVGHCEGFTESFDHHATASFAKHFAEAREIVGNTEVNIDRRTVLVAKLLGDLATNKESLAIANRNLSSVHEQNLRLAADKTSLLAANEEQAKHIRSLDEMNRNQAATIRAVMDNADKFRSEKRPIRIEDYIKEMAKRIASLTEEIQYVRSSIVGIAGLQHWLDVPTKTMIGNLRAMYEASERKYKALKNALGTHGCDNSLKEIKRLKEVEKSKPIYVDSINSERIERIRKVTGVLNFGDAVARVEALAASDAAIRKIALNTNSVLQCTSDPTENLVHKMRQAIEHLKENQIDSEWGDICIHLKGLVGVNTFSEVPASVEAIVKQNSELCNRLYQEFKHAQPLSNQDLQQRIEKVEGQLRELRRDVDGKKLGYTDLRV